MTSLQSHPSTPTAYGSARLLAGTTHGRPVDLARHRELHGEQRFCSQTDLVDLARQVHLLGRGGAGFPVAIKLEAMPHGGRTHVLINGSESEPASQKDRTLMRWAPHLVLDGGLAVARALGTANITIAVHDTAAALALRAAIEARPDAGAIHLVTHDGGFVSGEIRSVLHAVDGRPAVPPGRRVLPHVHGIGGEATFASNVETFAQIALLISLGAQEFASVGSRSEPGTTLLTLLGDLPHVGVIEVPTGLPLAVLLPEQDTDPRPVLIGGYHGSWVTDLGDLTVDRPALRSAGTPLNAGVIARLSHDTCALSEVASVSVWLAGESAGQCGPCFFGLPSIARGVAALVQGQDPGDQLTQRVAQLPGRGACAHPDGSAMFVRTALETMTEEIDLHRRRGTCGRPWHGELS